MSNYFRDPMEEVNKYLVVTKYIDGNEFDKLIETILENGIEFYRGMPYPPLRNDIRLRELSDYGCFDFSPIFDIYTCKGEYGFAKLTMYASGVDDDALLGRYEYQYKGQIETINFYSEK